MKNRYSAAAGVSHRVLRVSTMVPAMIMLLSGLMMLTPMAQAETHVDMGRAVMLQGDVRALVQGQVSAPIELGQRLQEGNIVFTGDTGHVRILMNNRSVVDLGPKSRIRLSYIKGPQLNRVGIFTFFGRMWARVARGHGEDRFEVETQNAVAGVRGTSFFIETPPEGMSGDTRVSVMAGSVALNGGSAEVLLGAMQEGLLAHGQGVEAAKVRVRSLTAADIGRLRTSIITKSRFRGSRLGLARLKQKRARLNITRGRIFRQRQRLRRRVGRRWRRGLNIDPGVARELFDRFKRGG